MGLFCVNFHFRTNDDKALSASLKSRGVTRHRVLPARNGWTTLYEERASQQDEARIRDLAAGLSKDLHVPAIAFMVHDSDIACYWLFDDGRPLDEFNSCPDYFGGGDEPAGPEGGNPDSLLPYCRPGTTREQLSEILGGDEVFADSVIEQLADALGIDPERALSDFRDLEEGDGPDGSDDDEDGDDDDDGPRGGPEILSMRAGLAGQMAKMLGGEGTADPQAVALVQAAADDDVAEIDRLLAEGAVIDAEAPASLPGSNSMAGLGKVFAGGMPKVAMTPLIAAISNKHRRATERLLDGGADPNHVHRLFGTAVHAAIGMGDADLLELILDRGGDVNARNAQGQKPLDIVAAGRASREHIEQAQAMIKSMGVKLPGQLGQLEQLSLPVAGWDACERLLKARGS